MPALIKRGKRHPTWYSNFPVRRYGPDGEILRKPNGRISFTRIRWALDTDKEIAHEKLTDLLKIRRVADEREIPFGRQYEISRHATRGGQWGSFREKLLKQSDATQDKNTHAAYKRALTNLEGHTPLAQVDDVTPALLDEVKADWKAAGRGIYVINRDIRAIKTAMRKAESWKLVEKQEWRSVKEFKVPKGRVHFHTPAQLRTLVQVCRRAPVSKLWLTVCLLGAKAGLRRGEMRWLEFSDLDFKNNRIHIAAKEGWNPKDYERRWIPMFSALRRHLLELKRKADSRWVLAQEGDRPSIGSITTYFGRLTRKAKLEGNVHTLRHTFGAHLTQAGVSPQKIKEWMGHASLDTTEIYMHLRPVDATEKDIERLPRL